MCDPVTAVSMGVQAGNQLNQYMNAKAEAEWTNDWNKHQEKVHRQFAIADYVQQNALIRRRQSQEEALAGKDAERVALESLRARGTAATAAAESGAAGGSAAAVLQDFIRQEIVYRDTLAKRTREQGQQYDEELIGMERALNMQLTQMRQPEVPKPSILGLVLGIGGSGTSAFSQNYKWDAQSGSYTPR